MLVCIYLGIYPQLDLTRPLAYTSGFTELASKADSESAAI